MAQLIDALAQVCAQFPDKRQGENKRYAMRDLALTAFSVFHFQSPSFLAGQRQLNSTRGRSNCQSLFGIDKMATDNHIRDMLDPVAPQHLYGLFGTALETAKTHGALKPFMRDLGGAEPHALIALDGSEYHCSKTIHCPSCQTRKRRDGSQEYYHSFLSAALVAPGQSQVLPLVPEFIVPQDGHEKQDCENAAIKRWMNHNAQQYQWLNPVYLGDDLMSRQPICQAVLDQEGSFLFVAKPSSHKTLYDWLDGAELSTLSRSVKKGRTTSRFEYRWLTDVPLLDGEDALRVNWFELRIYDAKGKQTYANSFVTNLPISAETVAELAACGRARWKIENEQFNTIKNAGYNLEHNFGHGKQHLAALLATMNLIAFAFHTVADMTDELWQQARKIIGSRKAFFQNCLVLTRYLVFPDWKSLVKTIVDGQPPPEITAA